MRADTAARSIVFVLKIGPLLLTEAIHLALARTTVLIDAEQYLSGTWVGFVDCRGSANRRWFCALVH